MGLAIRTPSVVADLFLDDVAAVAGLGRLVGSFGHFFAVGEEVALDGLEAVAGLGFHFNARSGGLVGVPFDEAQAAGTAEENILGLQLDLRGIALAVKDEQLGGAVELLRLGHAPQQQPQGARLELKVEQIAPFVGDRGQQFVVKGAFDDWVGAVAGGAVGDEEVEARPTALLVALEAVEERASARHNRQPYKAIDAEDVAEIDYGPDA